MLFQLVCIDRRYQRMNCFNVRELQSILKCQFSNDLQNTFDFHTTLSKTLISLRPKMNNSLNLYNDSFLFTFTGINQKLQVKEFNFMTNYNNFFLSKDFCNNLLKTVYYFINSSFLEKINEVQLQLEHFLLFIINFSRSGFFSLFVYTEIFFFSLKELFYSKSLNILHLYFNSGISLNTNPFKNIYKINFIKESNKFIVTYSSKQHTNNKNKLLNMIDSPNTRFIRFTTPFINYDYKCGHYLGIWEELYPSLLLSFIEVSRGIYKPS